MKKLSFDTSRTIRVAQIKVYENRTVNALRFLDGTGSTILDTRMN